MADGTECYSCENLTYELCALDEYIAYHVTIDLETSATCNKVYFRGTTTVCLTVKNMFMISKKVVYRWICTGNVTV